MIAKALTPLKQYTAQRWVVAFSGGVDSTVLLHALVHSGLFDTDRIVALHINHQLQPESDSWVEHCAAQSASMGVSFESRVIESKPEAGDSLEAFAREVRRGQFRSFLQAGDVLLVAQHQEDQAETVLLQLCRGAGIAGLSGMAFESKMGRERCLRPFLEVSKSDIHRYAQQHDLSWIEDPSNQDSRFSRNFLRHEVLPLLKAHYPGVVKAMTRSASHCQQACELVDDWSTQALNDCLKNQLLSVGELKKFSIEKQQVILRHWLKQQGFRVSQAQLQQLQQQAHARGGANVDWRNRDVSVYREAGNLIAKPTL